MTPLDPVTLSFGAALLLGLVFGSGPCNIACLPYLGLVLMTGSEGIRGAWRTLLPFSLGRMSGYALLGSGAGALGLLVQDWIAGPWVRWLLGGATILVALSLFRRQHRAARVCQHAASRTGSVLYSAEQWTHPGHGYREAFSDGCRHGVQSLCTSEYGSTGCSDYRERHSRSLSWP